jgi:hypothetical protein
MISTLVLQMKGTLDRSLMFLIYVDPMTSVVCSFVFVVTVGLRYFSVATPEICDMVNKPVFFNRVFGPTG